MITHEICSEKNASLACLLQAECKVHMQKSGCREVNNLVDLRNYHVMHMDMGEHSQSHRYSASIRQWEEWSRCCHVSISRTDGPRVQAKTVNE